jgi:hypothetical protein
LKGYTSKDFIVGANDFGVQVKIFNDGKEADAFIQNLKRDKQLGVSLNQATVRLFSIDEEYLNEIKTPEAEAAYILEYQKMQANNK